MFRINETNYQATVAKVQKINQRAQKRGFTGHITLDAQQVVGSIVFLDTDALGEELGTLKATIKAQDTFKDVKQTLVTRAKVQA
jgi:hypothetical protein